MSVNRFDRNVVDTLINQMPDMNVSKHSEETLKASTVSRFTLSHKQAPRVYKCADRTG